MEKEYKENDEFRGYVDRYCESRGISVAEALTHKMVAHYLAYLRDR